MLHTLVSQVLTHCSSNWAEDHDSCFCFFLLPTPGKFWHTMWTEKAPRSSEMQIRVVLHCTASSVNFRGWKTQRKGHSTKKVGALLLSPSTDHKTEHQKSALNYCSRMTRGISQVGLHQNVSNNVLLINMIGNYPNQSHFVVPYYAMRHFLCHIQEPKLQLCLYH